MDDTKSQKLEALLKEGKLDEAKALIREIVTAPLSQEEEGAALIQIASAYLDAANAADAAYIEALEKAVEATKPV